MINYFERDDNELIDLALNTDERELAIKQLSRQRRIYLTLGALTLLLFVMGLAFQTFGNSGRMEPYLIGAAILLVIWLLQLDQKIKLLKVIGKLNNSRTGS